MKLYFFNPNTFNLHYTTCAESKEQALEQLKSHLKNKYFKREKEIEKEKQELDSKYHWSINNFYEDEYNEWKDISIDKLPYKYTIDEHELTDIITGEFA